jgi:tetratricopeptide (TPR) repeat protein
MPANFHRRAIIVCGAALALGAFAVYAATAYRTVPFWDAGEFIATSTILGIPHQPSTPLYVLIGRVATLVPVGSIALRMNLLSAVATALMVLFTFLAVERLGRRMFSEAPRAGTASARSQVGTNAAASAPAKPPAAAASVAPARLQVPMQIAPIVAGLVAGALVAFSSTIWFNAIEAEVYSLSGMVVALSLWLVVRWADRASAAKGASAGAWSPSHDFRVLLLVFYLLGLSVGIHLGTYLVLPALLVFVIHQQVGQWGRTFSLLAALGAGLLAVALAGGIAGAMGAGLESGAIGFLVVSLLLLLVPRLRRTTAILLFLLLLGLSVHLFLPIRSHLDPVINESEPDNWRAFWDTLTRAQYPPSNPLVRRAPLDFQFGHMFLRYVREQWPLLPGLAGPVAGTLLVGGAAVAGAWAQARRERSGFALLAMLALVTGPGMVIYLNFTDNEVRERDYFFTPFFQTMAMWAGLGAGTAVQSLAGLRRGETRLPRLAAAGVLVVLIALLPAKIQWFTHDRSRDSIARDYAYNMLVPLPQDSILFTNGDNDTFPLWYLQEVENIRKDVRVVNLSLLNTTWYIRQVRDYEPRVPIRLTDIEIQALQPNIDRKSGKLVLVKDLAVSQILADNQNQRPLYLAVTVPDRMGLDERLTMEGLSHRIHPAPTDVRIELETCRRNVYEVFTPLRGVLTPEGKTDWSIHRDQNQTRLLQNYAAIHFYMAIEYDQRGKVEEALAEAKRAQEVSPGFGGNRLFLGILYEKLGQMANAEMHYRESLAMTGASEDPRLNHRLGWVVAQQGRYDDAVPILRKAIQLGGPGYFDPYGSLFEIHMKLGQVDQAVAILDTWLAAHPEDAEVRQVRDLARSGVFPSDPRKPAEAP